MRCSARARRTDHDLFNRSSTIVLICCYKMCKSTSDRSRFKSRLIQSIVYRRSCICGYEMFYKSTSDRSRSRSRSVQYIVYSRSCICRYDMLCKNRIIHIQSILCARPVSHCYPTYNRQASSRSWFRSYRPRHPLFAFSAANDGGYRCPKDNERRKRNQQTNSPLKPFDFFRGGEQNKIHTSDR